MLKEGGSVKDFSLMDQTGNKIVFSSLKNKYRIIYFYPKDNTPGCTKEACAFRDDYSEFSDLDAIVLGISGDTPESHGKFASKFNLPFTLLSDTDNTLAKSFGAWGKKTMYGKEYEGIFRSTFVVDRKGTIIKAFLKVKPEEHAREVIEYLSCMEAVAVK